MSEWQPITAAPKGQMVKLPPGSYVSEMWEAPALLLADPEYGVIAGWYQEDDAFSGWLDRSNCVFLNPTHWQPLPPPPVEEGG